MGRAYVEYSREVTDSDSGCRNFQLEGTLEELLKKHLRKSLSVEVLESRCRIPLGKSGLLSALLQKRFLVFLTLTAEKLSSQDGSKVYANSNWPGSVFCGQNSEFHSSFIFLLKEILPAKVSKAIAYTRFHGEFEKIKIQKSQELSMEHLGKVMEQRKQVHEGTLADKDTTVPGKAELRASIEAATMADPLSETQNHDVPEFGELSRKLEPKVRKLLVKMLNKDVFIDGIAEQFIRGLLDDFLRIETTNCQKCVDIVKSWNGTSGGKQSSSKAKFAYKRRQGLSIVTNETAGLFLRAKRTAEKGRAKILSAEALRVHDIQVTKPLEDAIYFLNSDSQSERYLVLYSGNVQDDSESSISHFLVF